MQRAYRIGQIVPSSNTTMETEIPAMFRSREAIGPERFTFHSSRMRMHKVTPEELVKMNKEGVRCAAELSDARVDVLSTACLVAIMAMGHGYHRTVERELRTAVEQNGSTAKIATSAGALIEGLKAMGAKRIALLAPYTKPLTQLVVAYIEAEGITVTDHRCFEIADNLMVADRDPMLLLEDAKRLDTSNVDVVVLSACVQMRSLPAIERAEQLLGKPVTSTSVCTAWRMLSALNLSTKIPECGSLGSGAYKWLDNEA